MTGIAQNKFVNLPRTNFVCWQELNQSKELIGATLNFSDYGIINPIKPEIDFAVQGIPPKVRYTLDENWVVYRGDHYEDRNDKYAEHQRMASIIVQSDFYKKSDFSWGDSSLLELSNGKIQIGSFAKIIEIDLNHHITFVSHQVSDILENLKNQ